MLLTACSDDKYPDSGAPGGDANIVTFTVSLQSQSVSTRADGEKTFTISDGTHVDALIFAVYEVVTDKNGNQSYILAPEFKNSNDPVGLLRPAKGQNIIKVDKNSWPVKIQLSIDMAKQYKAVFWAQSSSTSAYDTSDLRRVKVNYAGALNNDELRDAFCGATDVFSLQSASLPHVVLHRPLAQINVGTSGWDYEGAAKLRPNPVTYMQSSVSLTGVAQYYDALAGKSITSDEGGRSLLTNVTFELNRMPSFIHVADDLPSLVELKPDYRRFKLEEYLYVDYTGDKAFWPYVDWDGYDKFRNEYPDDFDAGVLPATETFKYLSMCYVLVPEPSTVQNADGSSTKSGAVIDKMEIRTYGETTDKGLGLIQTLNNVPVQKNWRTNIINNRFYIVEKKFYVIVAPEYCGEHDFDSNDEGWMFDLDFGDSSGDNWSFTGGKKWNEDFFEKHGDDYGDPRK